MEKYVRNEVKSTELFMLAQFIDVIDVLEKYNTIDQIKKDINKRKKIYMENIKKMSENKDLMSLNLDNKSIDERIRDYKDNIMEKDKINDIHLAYKIGVIDGMKLKSKCT